MKLSYRFDGQNNNSARASRFLYISLRLLHDYNVKLASFKVMLHETICNDDF